MSKHIAALAEISGRVPDDHRNDYAKAMRDAASIVAIRNGLVHGIGFPDVEEDVWRTQRSDRSAEIEGEQSSASWTTTANYSSARGGGLLRSRASLKPGQPKGLLPAPVPDRSHGQGPARSRHVRVLSVTPPSPRA